MAGKNLGTTSPSEHLDNYAVHMALNPDHDALKCKLFGITLGEYARTWYINLPKGSIKSFAELREKFLAQFASSEPVRRPSEILHKIVQGHDEPLRSYMTRFSRVALTVTDFVDQTGRDGNFPRWAGDPPLMVQGWGVKFRGWSGDGSENNSPTGAGAGDGSEKNPRPRPRPPPPNKYIYFL